MIQIDTGLLELLPEYYATVKDYQQIMQTEETELEQMVDFINEVHDNFFLQTIDESAAADWEALLGISDSGNTTIEFRRTRILNRISMKPPFTLQFLYQKLDELIGKNKWNVIVDYENYTLYVETSAESQDFAVEVAYTINHIKPAHIVYISVPLLTGNLIVNETIYSSSLRFNYKLGSWALGASRFVDRGEESEYKLATVRSITNNLLDDVAGFVATDVVAARLNDSTVITGNDLHVEQTDNVLIITYTVPAGLSTITKIELLDSASSSANILSSATVYIPAASEIEIKHRLLVQEGVNE